MCWDVRYFSFSKTLFLKSPFCFIYLPAAVQPTMPVCCLSIVATMASSTIHPVWEVFRPHSHRTRKQICMQSCVQTLWCCLQPVWTLPLTTVCSMICVRVLQKVLCVLCERGLVLNINLWFLSLSHATQIMFPGSQMSFCCVCTKARISRAKPRDKSSRDESLLFCFPQEMYGFLFFAACLPTKHRKLPWGLGDVSVCDFCWN